MEIPTEEASTLQIGSVAFPPGQCTSPQLHPCYSLFDQDGHQDSGIVFIFVMSQSLTCSVVMGEGSFDTLLRNDIYLSALKAALNLEKEMWWCLVWFLLLVQDFLPGYTVELTQLYRKRCWRNMYLIWELLLINQLYLCRIRLHVTHRSPSRHFFLKRMLLLWSGLLKVQTWIQLRMFGSYFMKEQSKRIQETSKNYGLIWKENGRKYPLMNVRH